jgi:hypothetical protein
VAIVSVGYDGTVDEGNWGDISTEAGKLYGVVGAGDWKVTAASNPGQVNIAPGSGWGQGVFDKSDAIVTITQGSLPTSGSRWDMVVAHRDWTPPSGVTDFRILAGSATKQLPPRDNNRGVVDDQPIALLQWTAGQSAPTQIVDLRCWGGNGGLFAKDELALSYIGDIGARVKIGRSVWSRETDSNGSPTWVNEDGAEPWANIIAADNWSQAIGRCRKIARGAILQIDLETKYTGKLSTKDGWFIGKLPAGYKPANPQIVTGLCAMPGEGYLWAATCWVGPNDIQIAKPSEGWTAFKVQTIVALQ